MYEPYPYQERLMAAMAKGENMILVIPTGGGKTLASILPFLQSLAFKDGLLPEKALYAVPMRVLATQFKKTCQETMNDINPHLFKGLEARYKKFGRALLSIQTGESPEDPKFESMITACTIDQLLASALGIPYSLSASQANINVGAICSSYLILDEPHLYPLNNEDRDYRGALTTCLELLRLLKGMTHFVFMSATMSSELVKALSKALDARIITVTADELVKLNKGRVRTFERSTIPMQAEHVLELHDRCSLVVCNTVQQAQEIYIQIHAYVETRGLETEVRLLHSRFENEARAQKSTDLCQSLGKEQWKGGQYQGEKSLIVVATQVVEVGLDISVQILHTENAPANSLIQRAGRCARFELQHGRVIVYPLSTDKEDKPVSSLPYSTTVCDATWQALEQFDGQVMGFKEEQKLVDDVHTQRDLALLQRYETHRHELQTEITESLRKYERSEASSLIRDITQVQLIVHNNPAEITKEPWRWQSFSLHPSLLQGKHWENLRKRQTELDPDPNWSFKKPVLTPTPGAEEEDSQQISTYTWATITSSAEIPGTLMIAVPNQLITYDQDLGLVFLDGRLEILEPWRLRLAAQNYQSSYLERKRPGRDRQPICMQSYQQHIGGLADAYHYAIRHELTYTMRCLEALMNLQPGTIDHAIQLAIATHDLGKLDRKWQSWARRWQHTRHVKENWLAIYQEEGADYFFAKTDYDSNSQKEREWQKEVSAKHPRPRHACESVMIARKMLAQSLKITTFTSPNRPVLQAICAAIAHHHSPLAHEYGPTSIDPKALVTIQQAIEGVRRGSDWSYTLDEQLTLQFDKGDLSPINDSSGKFTKSDVASGPDELLETWLQFIIVRALRLADQRADSYVTKR